MKKPKEGHTKMHYNQTVKTYKERIWKAARGK